jgi:hypothetical protein
MQSAQALIDPFDRSNGNGSRSSSDDWLDEESIFSNEWGSTAATTFKPEDGPATKRDRLERWYDLQNGKGESSRKDTIRASHIQNDAETFMSVLEMPSRQRDTVREILDNLDISSNNFGGQRYEKIILAICSLVADEALSNQPNPSINDRLFLSDEFRDLMRVNEMSGSEHRQIRVNVRQKSDYFSK